MAANRSKAATLVLPNGFRTRWKPGMPSPNPTGKSLPERIAARSISEACRDLVDPSDFARTLLAIYSGVDPFDADEPQPDYMPRTIPSPPDWTHRMAAAKMFGEWAYGKPLQGIAVQAEIRQQTELTSGTGGPVDVRALSPEAQQALRIVAQAVLGRVTQTVIDVPSDDRGETVAAGGDVVLTPRQDNLAAHEREVDRGRRVLPVVEDDSDEVAVREEIPDAGASVGDLRVVHDQDIAVPAAVVNKKFPRSNNVASAELDTATGILEVAFHSSRGLQKYKYANFTLDLLDEWCKAESAGSWFHDRVKSRPDLHPIAASTKNRVPGVVL